MRSPVSADDLRHRLRLIRADKTPVLVLKSSMRPGGDRRSARRAFEEQIERRRRRRTESRKVVDPDPAF
jgi:hypothetical protein